MMTSNPKYMWACVVCVILLVLMIGALYRAFKLQYVGPKDVGGAVEGFADIKYPWLRVESLEKIQSLYHRIEVIDTKQADLGKCLLLNDEIQLCSGEQVKYHELIVHFGAQYLPGATPKNVIIIGGGDCMVLREVMKYPGIAKVTVLELDDMVTRVSEKHFAVDRYAKDARVTWMFGNVRANVKKLRAAGSSTYDFIISDTTETTDHNAETDTTSFFTDLRDLLTSDGVFVKNGDGSAALMKSTFSFTMVYGYDSKTHASRYSFTLGSGFDFKQRIVTTGVWFAHSVQTEVYNPDHHFEYLAWTETPSWTAS
ncbi:Spermidine synthase [Tetrabaena socialis]|uniref:Spermidine synthase n=1 Tax=Tetrabaena socialis TaxID=47790 RepID=A0A2J7ZMW7_9CHLO|nr:Spermidine synthase [Tetrabaena socialis]|eukprot:PNH01615.1 Spermidine synthase [Tetrabaena socialis]